jgi:hypothetical protein
MRLILVGVVVSSFGCDAPKPSAPASGSAAPAPAAPAGPAKPLAMTWSDDQGVKQAFAITGGGGSGYAMGGEKGVTVSLDHFAAGSTYKIGGKQGTTDTTSVVDVPGLDFLAAIAYDNIDHVDTGLTLTLALPDGRAGDSKLPPLSFKFSLQDMFKRIEHGPITFGKEPDDPKPSDSIFYVAGGVGGDIVGKAGTLAQIDFVATQEMQDATGKKTCKGYDGPHPTITINLKPTEVSLWNRRTGDLVEKKVFTPDDECPMMAMTSADSDQTDSYPPTEKITAWLKSKIKR